MRRRFGLISIVVPIAAWDESWKNLLFDLSRLQKEYSIPIEILFVTTQSKFKEQVRENIKVTWVFSDDSSRPYQMNLGAKHATGEFIWFLHADSRFRLKVFSKLLRSIEKYPKALYYFDLKFLPGGPLLMFINTIGCWLRSRILKMPFGDQGFCISKKLFFSLGWYDEDLKQGEDHHFVWKCRQNKVPVKPVKGTLFTSARKYREQGWLKMTFKYLFLTYKQAIPQWLKLIKGAK